MTEYERFNKLIDLVTQATSWDLSIDEELQKLKYPEKPNSGILMTECKGPRYENPIEKPKQSKFELDDYVRVYTRENNLLKTFTGHIQHIDRRDNTIYVIDKGNDKGWFYIKQCRRLRKKQK